MNIKIEISLTFDGPFNVGAGALGGSLADKPLTRDARRLPMVPASAFKGRLRHEVERLTPHIRPDDRPPCRAPVAETMCQGDETPCPVCQLFGSPWRSGKLTFSNLLLAEPSFLTTGPPPPGDLRPGVGLSRHRKVAEDQLLYTTEIFLPGTPMTLKGDITGDLNEAEQALLEAGLQSLFTVGGGKTKGLGWFDLTFDIQTEPESTAQVSESQPGEEALDVIIELQSPLLLGTDTDEAFYKTTRDYISGRVLRGSLAQLMLMACDHNTDELHENCDFAPLFTTNSPPIFEYLYPTTGYDFSLPIPLTARSCKYHPGFKETKHSTDQGHGVGDILIRQTVFEHMLKAQLDNDLKQPLPMLYQPRCPECQAEVDRVQGNLIMLRLDDFSEESSFQFDNVPVPIRRTSHTAINRHRAVASDNQLYTLETIEPEDNKGRPTIFRGAIQGTPDQIEILRKWLPRLSALGRGQSRGLGHVQIEVSSPNKLDNPLPLLAERLEKFNLAFQSEWTFYEPLTGIEPIPDEVNYFSLTLLSPAGLIWQGLPTTIPPPEMLGFKKGVDLVRAFSDHQMVGGWHLGAGLPRRTQLAVAMGSVFLYRSEGLSETELAQKLTELETKGLGNKTLRRQGFGRVAVCLPFHYQPEVTL